MRKMDDEILWMALSKYCDLQVTVAIEEMSELQKELCKALRRKGNHEHITEEMADVYITLRQMQLYYGISKEELQEWIDKKMQRLEDMLID